MTKLTTTFVVDGVPYVLADTIEHEENHEQFVIRHSVRIIRWVSAGGFKTIESLSTVSE